MARSTRKRSDEGPPQPPEHFTRALALEDWLSEDEINSYDPARGDEHDFWHKMGSVALLRRERAWRVWAVSVGLEDSRQVPHGEPRDLRVGTPGEFGGYLYAFIAPRVRRTDRAPTYGDVPKVDPSDPEVAREMMRPKSVPIYYLPRELERELSRR